MAFKQTIQTQTMPTRQIILTEKHPGKELFDPKAKAHARKVVKRLERRWNSNNLTPAQKFERMKDMLSREKEISVPLMRKLKSRSDTIFIKKEIRREKNLIMKFLYISFLLPILYGIKVFNAIMPTFSDSPGADNAAGHRNSEKARNINDFFTRN